MRTTVRIVFLSLRLQDKSEGQGDLGAWRGNYLGVRMTDRPRHRRTWLQAARRSLLVYAVVPCAAVTMILFLFQRSLMYRPTTAAELKVADAGFQNGRDVQITTADGITLRGWWIAAENASDGAPATRRLAIYFPGNSLNRAERADDFRVFLDCGFDVLIFDYRGYGDSDGWPVEAGMEEDAKSVWNFAIGDCGFQPNEIVIFGESLGGAVALSLWDQESAEPVAPRALVLNSTFSSMPDAVAATYPGLPFHLMVLDRWPSIDRIARVNCPVTIFHGTADSMVPIEQARQLVAANPRARLIENQGAEHNEVPTSKLRGLLGRL